METITAVPDFFASRPPPRLRRNHSGHLTLHCGPSKRRKLKVWVLLRLRHGFCPLPDGGERILVRGNIRLRVCIDDQSELSVTAESGAGDAFLRRLRRNWTPESSVLR